MKKINLENNEKNNSITLQIENFIPLSRKLMLGCLISIFTFQSSVITSVVTILDCVEIQGKYYIREYLIESCGGNQYITFYYYLVLPDSLPVSLNKLNNLYF